MTAVRYAGSVIVGLLVAEVVAAVAVARATSWDAAVLLLIALSALGAVLVRRELSMVVRSRHRGQPRSILAATDGLADTAVRIGGSLLVLIPGFVTAAAGLLLLLPPVRVAVRRRAGARWARRLAPVMGRTSVFRRGGGGAEQPRDDDHVVIEGTVGERGTTRPVNLRKHPDARS